MQYARELKNYMVKHGMNQQMFADMIGCSNQSVSNWLRAFRIPTGELKKKVDAILDGEKKEGEKEVSLAKNGSGYYDPTAHNAFKNIISESKPACLRGDIYTFELKNSATERKMLVVSSDDRKFDRWISALVLNDEAKGRNIVPIKASAMMYADCDRVTYIDRNNVLGFIRTATSEEMAQIDAAIAESLGINTNDVELSNKLQEAEYWADDFAKENTKLKKDLDVLRDESVRLKTEYDKLKDDYNMISEKCSMKEVRPSADSDEVVRLKAMIDVYKDQNEMLLEKLIG